MMTLLTSIIILFSIFLVELLYFKIANHFNIIDKPNERSSHSSITLRGGGIIFAVAAVGFYFFSEFQYPFFIIGLVAISIISFLDDILTLNNKIRLSIHLMSVLLMFYQWDLFALSWYWLIIAGIFVIATINAYNFMDGINGITGSYSLLAVITLYYINNFVIEFTNNDLLIITGLSLLVFNFFNFRKKAKCFAGDVGSVSIAFILVFVIGQLILKTHNFAYVLLLLLYGLDTVSTMLFRKVRGENIFKAHRSHFYQFLSNDKKYPQLIVSIIYFVLQLLVNAVVIFFIKDSVILALVITVLLSVVFFGIRFLIEGKERLLTKSS